MLLLSIRTDKPEAEIGLFDNHAKITYETWQAHRELSDTIHLKIEELLKQQGKTWQDIQGIVGFQGPGSFTGLRIGLTVANALAYGLHVPVVAEQGEDWTTKGIKQLLAGEHDPLALPEYGAAAHITLPKK
ncbi:MAG TPA: tRNA (adenosine(37)-N6)-threonylcarbamoyltransferase complex dimerization subunit type 1 TsaB [Candidatus Saccharimonadales bacterium]|nr:tRNA (adenosine(37)-N6)-threonylcarbamoyltransferase complex dimerization subunit type 1 TsaB [Candidatus Saccharimonadales bacterium]